MKWSEWYKEFVALAKMEGLTLGDLDFKISVIKKYWSKGYSVQEALELYIDYLD